MVENKIKCTLCGSQIFACRSDCKYCKECRRKVDIRHTKEWRKRNIEYTKEYDKKYNQENKERVKKWGINWRNNNKDHLKKYSKKYYHENKEKLKELREDNKEYIREYHKKYSKKHKEIIRANKIEWEKNNKEYVKEYSKEYGKEYYWKHKKDINWLINYREKGKGAVKKWAKNNPKKVKAKRLAQKIPLKKHCEICTGTNGLQRHHWNYDKPLLVNTLCRPCHRIQHIKWN